MLLNAVGLTNGYVERETLTEAESETNLFLQEAIFILFLTIKFPLTFC